MHVWLIGMMGSGKSSVGEACANVLERGWLDTDDLVVALAGRTIPELFDEGEALFREWERRAVCEASQSPVPLIISCGGGVANDATNRGLMTNSGSVVWLRARPETLVGRVGDTSTRPLLGPDPLETLRRLELLRTPFYESVADDVIDTDAVTLDEVVDRVVSYVVVSNGQ